VKGGLKMKLFKRKSQVQRLGENIKDSLDPSGTNFSLPGMGSPGKALKSAMPNKDKAVKAGLAVGGLTALTAASAGISSLRRRQEGARDDS
jgi:hypothetical protein